MNTITQPVFDMQSYKNMLTSFPPIRREDYQQEQDEIVRQSIIEKNRILQTDAYNRTMQYIRKEKGDVEEVFTLTLRKNAGAGYNIVYGIKKQLKAIFSTPISQHELDFAQAFYDEQKRKGGNYFFDPTMRQDIIDKHDGYIPLHIKAVADGTALRAGEPALWVRGKGELGARFEPLLTRIFYETSVATDYFEITKLMHEGRIAEVIYADEFGARSVINRQQHFAAAEAGIVGGGLQATSADATAAVYPQLRSSGTIAHRFLAAYPTEDDAFQDAVEKTEKITLLVDLIDSYQGIDKAIALKKKYRQTESNMSITLQQKKIGIRLDSGDLLNQTLYALRKYKEEGMLDPAMDKIIIADISSIQQLQDIEDAVRAAGFNPRDHIYYGLGELLVGKEKSRGRVSAAYKLTRTNGRNAGKRSDDIGKRPIPGVLNIEVRDTERVIVQDDEPVQGKRLLDTVYKNGILTYETDGIQYVDTARNHLLTTFSDIEKPTVLSAKTQAAMQEVADAFDTQMHTSVA